MRNHRAKVIHRAKRKDPTSKQLCPAMLLTREQMEEIPRLTLLILLYLKNVICLLWQLLQSQCLGYGKCSVNQFLVGNIRFFLRYFSDPGRNPLTYCKQGQEVISNTFSKLSSAEISPGNEYSNTN